MKMDPEDTLVNTTPSAIPLNQEDLQWIPNYIETTIYIEKLLITKARAHKIHEQSTYAYGWDRGS